MKKRKLVDADDLTRDDLERDWAEAQAYAKEGYDYPPSGRFHTCDMCGKRGPWGPGWAWYGSIADIEGKLRGYTYVRDAQPEKIVTTCSEPCREQSVATPIPGKHRVPRSAINEVIQ